MWTGSELGTVADSGEILLYIMNVEWKQLASLDIMHKVRHLLKNLITIFKFLNSDSEHL